MKRMLFVCLIFGNVVFASEEGTWMVRGKITAETPLRAMLFSLVAADGKLTPPIAVKVNVEGRFEARLKAGTYRFGTNPACVRIRNLELDEDSKRAEIHIHLSDGAQQSADGGITVSLNRLISVVSASYTRTDTNRGLTQSAGGIILPGLCSAPAVPSGVEKTPNEKTKPD